MLIRRTRIRSLARNLGGIEPGGSLVVGFVDLPSQGDRLEQIGFSRHPQPGETLLPASVGPVSLFNAEGKFITHRDQPMETAYRQVEWTWTEWHGRHQRVERSDIRDVPYLRYPRSFIEPPSAELTAASTDDGTTIVAFPAMTYDADGEEAILHQINVLLEIFGECEILDETLTPIIRAPINRVNWEVLPRGEMPWEQLEGVVRPLVERMRKGNQPVARYRLKTLNDLEPDFLAVGLAGFRGYLVFAFEGVNRYVVESLYYGNATYVFGNDWRELSQMTKAEILREGLHEARIVHRYGWGHAVRTAATGGPL